MVPPAPPRRPEVLRAHGDERTDDWYWLRERENPEVLAHLETENRFTGAVTARTEALQQSLYDEIVARIQETDLSVPVRKGPWLYYARTAEGSQYPIHCRRPAPADPPQAPEVPEEPGEVPPDETVILDENALAGDSEYFALGALAVSPDHRILAYSTDHTGAERYRLRMRVLATGEDLGEVVENTYYGVAWSKDSSTLFYTRPDDSMRPHQLWRHRLGTPVEEDSCVHQEDDEHFHLGVSQTKDDNYVLLELESKVTTEVWYLPGDDPMSEFGVIEPRRQGIEYSVAHHNGRFLIVTNDSAENFRLVESPVNAPGRDSWSDVLPAREDVKLDGIDVFDRHLAVFERANATTQVRVIDLDGDSVHVVEQPESVGTVWAGPNPEPGSKVLRYEYTSLVTPRSVYDYDMRTRSATLLKRQPVLGGFDPDRYRTERLWATSDDNTRVPISLVYRDDFSPDGNAPCLLYGYGSYEHSVDPVFSSMRLSLLDRGFAFAIAHVRGGGEMGRRWYLEGKLLEKTNTFHDFIACARHLVAEGWTSPERLVARGGSAGGMLMGAVANLAPELFAAIVAEVPFVDCLTTILDDSLPLTVLEWEEWGNPVEDPEVYFYMKSYSPYDNVTARRYPSLLVTSGLNDPRVSYWEPTKWVAKLRSSNPDNRVLLKTEMGAGHQGPSGRYDAWRDEAFVLSFILDSVGIDS